MTAQPSRITVDHAGDHSLSVAGVVDSHTADELLDALRSCGTDQDVTASLAGVEFMDSSGLRAVVTVHQELDAAGHRLVLADCSPTVTRLLEITGLDGHLNVS